MGDRKVRNRIWSVAEQGCKWRGLPSRFGNWHPIYRRMNRWAKTWVLNLRFEAWPAKKIIPVRIEGYSLRLESQEEGGPQKSICWPKMLVRQQLFDSPLATVIDRTKKKEK